MEAYEGGSDQILQKSSKRLQGFYNCLALYFQVQFFAYGILFSNICTLLIKIIEAAIMGVRRARELSLY